MTPLLTIGCPTFRDFGRTLFTLQSLRLAGCLPGTGQLLRLPERVEFLVVDNDPGGPHSKRLREECEAAGIRYAVEPVQGSCSAKNRVFAEATGEWVLCIDSHVLFPPGLVDRLLAYCSAHPHSRDLIQAPLYNTHLHSSTLMTDQALYGEESGQALWSGGMWGQWRDRAELKPGWPQCDLSRPLPTASNGCWFLLMRRQAWPAFHCGCRGFGGEEGAIQELVRSRGGRVLTHPGFAGWHSFEAPHWNGETNPDGSPRREYAVNTPNMLINYALNLRKAGHPIDALRAYFLGTGTTESEWGEYMAEVERRERAGCGACGQQGEAPQLAPVEVRVPAQVQVSAPGKLPCEGKPQPVRRRDLREQADAALAVCPARLAVAAKRAAELAESRTVLEVCAVRTVASLAVQAQAGTLVSRCRLGNSPRRVVVDGEALFHLGGWSDPLPEVVGLAVLHALPGAEELAAWLGHMAAVRPARVLLLNTAESASPQVEPWALAPMRAWLRGAGQDYTVAEDSQEGVGWTLLSRLPEDKVTPPGLLTQAWNFAQAVAQHAAAGFEVLPQAEVEKRLDVCATCPTRVGNQCGRCGCPLDSVDGKPGRAYWAAMDCPLGKWPLPLRGEG